MFATLALAAALLLPFDAGEPVVINSQTVMVSGTLYAMNVYSNGQAALQSVEGGGISYLAVTGMEIVFFNGDDRRQRLETSWRDSRGVKHRVVTPIPGTTEGSLRAAIDRHRTAVDLLQMAFPPAPVNNGDHQTKRSATGIRFDLRTTPPRATEDTDLLPWAA